MAPKKGTKRRRRGPVRNKSRGVSVKNINGHLNRPRAVAPPVFSRLLYHPQTVPMTYVGGVDTIILVSVNDIIVALLKQRGLTDDQVTSMDRLITIKIRKIDVYVVATANSPEIPMAQLRCHALNNVYPTAEKETPIKHIPPPLAMQSDVGNLNEAARCSYTFPAAMQALPLKSRTSNIRVADVSGNTKNIQVRIYLDWTLGS